MATTPCKVYRAVTTSPILNRFHIIKDVQCDSEKPLAFMCLVKWIFKMFFKILL